MILGCLLLVLILNRYEFKTKVSALTPPAPTSSLAMDADTVNFFTVHL